MASFARQLECLKCSQTRSFVHHTETSQRLISQAEALALPRDAIVTCGRCGSATVHCGWGDALRCAMLLAHQPRSEFSRPTWSVVAVQRVQAPRRKRLPRSRQQGVNGRTRT
jgi:hypothetical protein